jgi:hypothetical protein
MTERPTTPSAAELNPGSFNDFVAQHDITDRTEAIERHSAATHIYALALAAEAGMTLEELRTTPGIVGQPAVRTNR